MDSQVRSFTYCPCVISRKAKDCQEKQLLRLRDLIGITLQKQIRPDANFPSALGFMIARLHTELSVRNSPGFAGRRSQKNELFSKGPSIPRCITPVLSVTVGHLFAHKAQIDGSFHSAQRMIGSHSLLQVYRIIKELRLALPLSQHEGNTLLAHLPQLGYVFSFHSGRFGQHALET